MPDQLLTILKFCLLALMYLFFLRVLRAVWAEITPPKPGAARARRGAGQPVPSMPMAAPVPQPQPQMASGPGAAHAATGAVPRVPTGGGAGQLVVIEPAAMQGRAYPLGNEATLGRAAHCTVTVDDTFVSQEHVRFVQRDGAYIVEDLGSTNGSYLNRARLSGAMMMQPGDRLQVGNTVLELR